VFNFIKIMHNFFHDISYYNKFQQNPRCSCQISAQNWLIWHGMTRMQARAYLPALIRSIYEDYTQGWGEGCA